jgi:phosphoglycolate phosphatase
LSLRLVIFDCDGTLVDSRHAIVGAMTAAFRAEGLAEPLPAMVRRVVGLPLVEAIAAIVADEDAARHERIAAAYRTAHLAARGGGAMLEPLFDGIREAIDELSTAGHLLGVATGKGSRGLRHTLDLHAIADRFVTLQTSDLCPGKPRPDMVIRALAETGVAAADAVVIGDTSFDMLMAANAGVAAIGVTWGYHPPDELIATGARCLVDHPVEIAPAVGRILGA